MLVSILLPCIVHVLGVSPTPPTHSYLRSRHLEGNYWQIKTNHTHITFPPFWGTEQASHKASVTLFQSEGNSAFWVVFQRQTYIKPALETTACNSTQIMYTLNEESKRNPRSHPRKSSTKGCQG